MIANAAQYERRIEMRVFISWSGDSSKRCAEVLRDWLPFMNQAIVPFVSSQDISKGERGLDKIANKLQDCSFGIVCVTRENQHAPWINFEAGALSRELGESMLAPFLLDLSIKDLSGPIAQFQATESGAPEEIFALVRTMNEKCKASVESGRLKITFERFLDDLSGKLEQVKKSQPAPAEPERDTSDILNELVGLTREQSSRLQGMERKFAHLNSPSEHNYVVNDPGALTINTSNTAASLAEVLPESQFYGFFVRKIGLSSIRRTLLTSFGAGLEFTVSADGMKRARAVEPELSTAAAELGRSVTIQDDGNHDRIYLAPF